MQQLLQQVRHCTLCEKHLEAGVNPIIAASAQSKIVIIGQAPGRIVHQTGIPWNDKSGDNLRKWLGVNAGIFYDPKIFALMPMGFCYPGKGASGDLPPRPECAPQWHQKLLQSMKQVQLIILVGQYAQQYYLKEATSLTDTVKNFRHCPAPYFPLPHPSPRNNIWQAKNKWFEKEVLPELRERVEQIIK
ncbi:uracil-DNA glycosylase family protein [Ferruginibacter sp.]